MLATAAALTGVSVASSAGIAVAKTAGGAAILAAELAATRAAAAVSSSRLSAAETVASEPTSLRCQVSLTLFLFGANTRNLTSTNESLAPPQEAEFKALDVRAKVGTCHALSVNAACSSQRVYNWRWYGTMETLQAAMFAQCYCV